MVKLGKEVKGRAPITHPKRCIVRIRHQDKGVEEMEQELVQIRAKRENLKV